MLQMLGYLYVLNHNMYKRNPKAKPMTNQSFLM